MIGCVVELYETKIERQFDLYEQTIEQNTSDHAELKRTFAKQIEAVVEDNIDHAVESDDGEHPDGHVAGNDGLVFIEGAKERRDEIDVVAENEPRPVAKRVCHHDNVG